MPDVIESALALICELHEEKQLQKTNARLSEKEANSCQGVIRELRDQLSAARSELALLKGVKECPTS